MPTPIPRIDGAQLGGSLHAFYAFGASWDALPYTIHSFSTMLGEQPAVIVVRDGGSADAVDRVREITVYEDDKATHAWDAPTATAIATTFLPSDAVHVRDEPDEFSPPHYVEHIYRSKLLAISLDASVFVDEVDLKTRNPPGTFTWWCVPFPSNTPGYGECKITVEAPKA